MELTVNHETDKTLDRRSGLSSVILRWAAFILGLLLIWAFIFVLAPMLQRLPSVQPLAEYIEKSGIDAGALYYTEVEEVGDAETNMRNTLEYPPQGP